MKTLKELVIASKCRKGQASGRTKRGAFWVALCVVTRRCGGDGIGNSGADVTYSLELRHYRDGGVSATIKRDSWHQNSGTDVRYEGCGSVLDCATAEEVVCALKGISFSDFYDHTDHVLSSLKEDEVIAALVDFGLAPCEPAPDEERGEAYHTGYEAAAQGETATANPYPSGTWDAEQWSEGFAAQSA